MDVDIILLFAILISITTWPVLKIVYRKDLNVFDLLVLIFSVQFIVAPLYANFADLHLHNILGFREIVNTHSLTFIYLCIIDALFLLCSFVVPTKSILNLTRYIRKLDSKLLLNKSVIWLILPCFIYVLVILTSFEGLNVDNMEDNRNVLYYGGDGILKYISPFSLYFSFVSMVWLVKILLSKGWRNFSKIERITLIVGCVVFLVGARTNIANVLSFIFIYLYSVKRFELKKKHLIFAASLLLLTVTILMPFTQMIRATKDFMISQGESSFSFFDVVNVVSSQKLSDSRSVDMVKDNTAERFATPYYYLDSSVYGDYKKFNGQYLLNVCVYAINPFYRPDEKWDNITANVLYGGGDIAESVPQTLYMDIGMWGSLLTPVFYIFIIVFVYCLMKLVNRILPAVGIEWYFVYFVLSYVLTVEKGVSVRFIWNFWLPQFVCYAIIINMLTKVLNVKIINKNHESYLYREK